MSKLAINGGKNIRNKSWPTRALYNKKNIKDTLYKIIELGNLSGYRGSFGQHFWGGKYARELEEWFENYIFEKTGDNTKVLAVNSCTSALHIACGAIGLKPYDEVIVTPWSMTCSATAPMVYGAKPVFVDIDKKYFCLDPKKIQKQITKNTKAIIAVDLFGHPYLDEINKIAKENNLFVIEDAAQAIGATYDGKLTGTLGDIGCFSFTQGKHFTCGEGGFLVIKDSELYMKCALLRNHAEAVINSMPKNIQNKYRNMENQHGFNMRMTELQAAVLLEQFNRENEIIVGSEPISLNNNIDYEVFKRQTIAEKLISKIKIDGIKWAETKENYTHSYYVLPFLFDEKKIGISRSKFIEAVKAELRTENTSMGITQKIDPLIWEGYIKPIYQMPIFRHRYYNDTFENVEDLQENKLCFTTFQSLPLSDEDIDDIVMAFYKVIENIEELK